MKVQGAAAAIASGRDRRPGDQAVVGVENLCNESHGSAHA